MQHVFVHGGPGLNSFPEQNLIGKKHPSFSFWSEPSARRDKVFSEEQAYQNWLKSLENFVNERAAQSPITIVAHSFAAFAVNDLLPSLQEKIAKLILIAPILNLKRLDTNILDLAMVLHAHDGNIGALKELGPLKENVPDVFNEDRFNILLKSLGREDLLSSYWHNEEAASRYGAFCTEEKYLFDLQSFKAVRATVPHDENVHRFTKETTIIYGAFDPVAKLEQDFPLVEKLYPQAKIRVSRTSGHYVHIEDPTILEEELR